MKIKIASEKFLKRKNLFREKLLHKDKKFLAVLEDDEYFEEKVFSIRKKFGIPSEGHSLDKVKKSIAGFPREFFNGLENLVKVPYKKAIKKDDLIRDAAYLCNEYNLSSRWVSSFFFFLIFNYFIPPFPDEPIRIVGEEEIRKELTDEKLSWFYPSGDAYIIIHRKIGKTQFVRLMKSKYQEIMAKLKDPLKVKELEVKEYPQVKIRNLEIYKRIYELRTKETKEEKKFAKIANTINDEFNRALDDADVRKMFERYKKQIDGLRKKRGERKG